MPETMGRVLVRGEKGTVAGAQKEWTGQPVEYLVVGKQKRRARREANSVECVVAELSGNDVTGECLTNAGQNYLTEKFLKIRLKISATTGAK